MPTATREEIHRFYHPQNVALVGVSSSFGFASGLPRFLVSQGWGDRVYPVNPKIKEIEGLRVYPSVKEIPVDIDLACIMVPAPVVPTVLRECIDKGVKAVILMSAGFAEIGPEGRKLQESVAEMAREAGIRMVGPNCIGVVNVPHRFATVEILLDELQPGNISIIAQSGVFGNILLDGMPSQDIRVAKVATIGNRADLDETDFLNYFADDPDTGVVILYLESIRRGREFLETARKVSLRKPILAYLGGQTEAGRKATSSHTGSMAGFRRLDKSLLRQAGIWIARDPAELLDTAKVFSLCPVPKGDRVLVVTASGSLGVMAADRLSEENLSLADPSPSSLAPLREKAPGWMNLGNPLDVGPSGLFREGMNVGLTSEEVDAVIAFPVIPWAVVSPLLEKDPEAPAGMFVDRENLEAALASKPVILSVQGHPKWAEACGRFFSEKVPTVSTPQAAVVALAALSRYGLWRRRNRGG